MHDYANLLLLLDNGAVDQDVIEQEEVPRSGLSTAHLGQHPLAK
jgi:hypothetical protein